MGLIINPFFVAPSVCPMIDTTSMTMWYKGYSDVFLLGVPAVDGGAVDQVVNQISTTDALQATGVNQPTWHENEINGKGIVRFDGSTDYLSIANGADSDITSPITFFFIVKIPAFTSFTVLLTKGANAFDQQYAVYLLPPGFGGRIAYCVNADCREVDALVAGLWERLIIRLDTVASRVFFYRNGVALGDASIPAQVVTASPARIGLRPNDSLGNPYDLLEMGAFNRNLTNQEILDLDCYMEDVVTS